jgi:hypothetical protein
MNVSAVVPTFSRGASLARTIATLAASERSGFDRLEILVVDDGSPVDVAPLVETLRRQAPAIPISLIRQPNAGPAAARNRGFRAASGDIVLFVDDDIEVPQGLVSAHVAAHSRHSGSVVFGRCVLPEADADAVVLRVLDDLGGDSGALSVADFEPCTLVASGQLSVRRAQFTDGAGVYREDLRTPAAEEYELSARLLRLGIPVFRANRITAVHRTELGLSQVCRGQYAHGRGCAEAAAKAPETLALPTLRRILDRQQASRSHVAGLMKRAGSSPVGRRALLRTARIARMLLGQHAPVALLYRWAIGAFFAAGVREGARDFMRSTPGSTSSPSPPGTGEPC